MTSITNSQPQVIDLSPEEFIRLANPHRLIDVRSSFEYRMLHVPNALNLSLPRILMSSNSWLSRWVLPQWFRELPKDQPIALICLTAHRSPMAAQKLVKVGFTKVYNITGGMMAWKKAHLPVEK